MINYAEEIAYLYFRLNGFFLLDNYVTHAGENHNRHHSDSDLLGIKTNLVYEEIGLNGEDDIDRQLRKLLGTFKYIGLICEVKGGTRVDLDNAESRIMPCIYRMGLLEIDKIQGAFDILSSQNHFVDDTSNTIILKVVATDNLVRPELLNMWNRITLTSMLSFIEKRARKYKQKRRGWNFYSSNLFQYLLKK